MDAEQVIPLSADEYDAELEARLARREACRLNFLGRVGRAATLRYDADVLEWEAEAIGARARGEERAGLCGRANVLRDRAAARRGDAAALRLAAATEEEAALRCAAELAEIDASVLLSRGMTLDEDDDGPAVFGAVGDFGDGKRYAQGGDDGCE